MMVQATDSFIVVIIFNYVSLLRFPHVHFEYNNTLEKSN